MKNSFIETEKIFFFPYLQTLNENAIFSHVRNSRCKYLNDDHIDPEEKLQTQLTKNSFVIRIWKMHFFLIFAQLNSLHF